MAASAQIRPPTPRTDTKTKQHDYSTIAAHLMCFFTSRLGRFRLVSEMHELLKFKMLFLARIGKFPSDPRAQYLLGIGNVACALQPEMIDIETLHTIADADGARALIKVDEVINAVKYNRIVPSNSTGAGRIRAAIHGPVLFRNRALLHYERKDLGPPELPRLALPDGGAAAESLKLHLVPKGETPQRSVLLPSTRG